MQQLIQYDLNAAFDHVGLFGTDQEESQEVKKLVYGALVNAWDSQIAYDAFKWSLLIGKHFQVRQVYGLGT